MLELLLFRHARAVPGRPGTGDEDRALTPDGREAAAAMGRLLAMRGLTPDRVLCSPALRTRQTLELAMSGWEPRPNAETLPHLYRAAAAAYLDAIRSCAGARRLMLVGHNPAIEEAARELSGEGAPESLARLFAGFPTAAVAVIAFDVEAWDRVGDKAGRLAAFLTAD